jgi:hypothetical protein
MRQFIRHGLTGDIQKPARHHAPNFASAMHIHQL